MSVIGTATAGMSAALRRMDITATRIAAGDAAATRETAERAEARAGTRRVEETADLARDAADLVAEQVNVEANAAVARTGSRLTGRLLDIMA